jgi:hypothetical protein
MSLFDCIQRAIDDPEIKADKARGQRAQEEWKRVSDRYEAHGHPRHAAEALAGEDVKAAFKKEAGEKRHINLAIANQIRKSQAIVANAEKPNMSLRVEQIDYKTRNLQHYFNNRLSAYFDQYQRKWTGKVTNGDTEADLAQELNGISTGNEQARIIGMAVKDVVEEMRVMHNQAGGLIPKLENYDLPHEHNALMMRRAKFPKWFSAIEKRLNWDAILDPLTGKPFQVGPDGKIPMSSKESFLKSVYDNIIYGKEAETPVYGAPEGIATYRRHSQSRHLHFKTGKDWLEYNAEFGSGSIFSTLVGHMQSMARDIVLMQEFGPNPKLGAKYEADLWQARAKKEGREDWISGIAGDSAVAMRALNVLSGAPMAATDGERQFATVMSNLRGAVTAARLDRAIFASFSDLNTARMAAKSMGMNSNGILARQVGLVNDLTDSEKLRISWVADRLTDPTAQSARFENEVAMSGIMENTVHMAMRIQGLSWWTDRGRFSATAEFSGFLAENADKPLAEVNESLLRNLQRWGVTDREWDDFRRPEHFMVAESGATFLSPIDFFKNTKLDRQRAKDIFFKIGGLQEDFIEWAIPTRNVLAQARIDPTAHNATPGTIPFEVGKSMGMFKSFPLTFSIRQYRAIQEQGGIRSAGGAAYFAELITGATILGALSIQVAEVAYGKDPQDMTDPLFWGRAAAKGGGFGVLGDIVTTGQASWGGGFSSYIAGPMPQLATDIWDLGPNNLLTAAYQIMTGSEIDTNFAQELAKFGKANLPMGQTPLVGPVLDRMIWDQMAIYLDPEAHDALISAAQRRANLNGSGDYWLPGDLAPSRAPDLMNAFGQ